MIYNRLDGTTSNQFKIGKKGVELQTTEEGTLAIKERDGTFRNIGVDTIQLDTTNEDIPTVGAVREAIYNKIQTVEDIYDPSPDDLGNENIVKINVSNGAAVTDFIASLKNNDYIYIQKEKEVTTNGL